MLSAAGTSRPVSRFTSVMGNDHSSRFVAGIADDFSLRRLAAAEIDHQPRRKFQARNHELRIDATLEAVARVGDDAQLAAGAGDVERIPQVPIRSARRPCFRRSRNARRP